MLGTNIREYRKNKKLTIKELAERTGLSIGYISQVEREEAEPSLSSLRKIAREFGGAPDCSHQKKQCGI